MSLKVAKYLSVQPKINEIFTTIKQTEVPDIDIGRYCLAPTECGFTQHCWQQKKIPDVSVFDLPRINNKKWEFYYDGIIALNDPRLSGLNELQERVVTCFKSGERYINKKSIQTALSGWRFPLVFLDFETINPAIPRYDECRPFEHVPFQFSAHTWQTSSRYKI